MRGLLGRQGGLIGDRDRRALLANTCAEYCCAGGCRYIKFVWCCYPEREPLWLFLNEPSCPNRSPAFEVVPTDIPRTYNIEGNCYTTDPTDIRLGEQIPDGAVIRGIRVGVDSTVDNCTDPTCAPCPECCGSVVPGFGCGFPATPDENGQPPEYCCECGDNYTLRVTARYNYTADFTLGQSCDITQVLGEFTGSEVCESILTAEIRYECEPDPNFPEGTVFRRKIVQVLNQRTSDRVFRKLDAIATCCNPDGSGGLTIVGEMPPVREILPDEILRWVPPHEGCGQDASRFPPAIRGTGDPISTSLFQPECSGVLIYDSPPCPNGSYACVLLGLPPLKRVEWNGFRDCDSGSFNATSEGLMDGTILARITPYSNSPTCGCVPECGVPTEGSLAGVTRFRSSLSIQWEKSPGEPCSVPPCESQQPPVGFTASTRRSVPATPSAGSRTVVVPSPAKSLVERALEGL